MFYIPTILCFIVSISVDGICEQDPTICGDNALCRSNEEGYTCECIEGYQTNEQGLCDGKDQGWLGWSAVSKVIIEFGF